MTTVHRNTKRTRGAIAEAITAALADEGKTVDDITVAPKKPKRKTRTVTRNRRNSGKSNMTQRVGIGWEHPLSTLTISVDEGNCVETAAEGPYTFAKIHFDDYRPASLNIRFRTADTEANTLTYTVHGEDRIMKVNGNLPTLIVPIEWQKNGVPKVRQKHEDNCDIIFMDEHGRFVQLMVGVVVRSRFNRDTGKTKWAMFLNLQEQFTGQVVRTTKAKATNLGLTYVEHEGTVATVIPLFDYHAYDGVDWLSITGSASFGTKTLVPVAISEGRSVPMSRASAETWNPPELGEPTKPGRQRAVVLWYNTAWNGGSGFIQTADGKTHFLHWSQLRNVYVPQPMTVVEFRLGSHQGKEQAQHVFAV